jgi:hypothetical protein
MDLNHRDRVAFLLLGPFSPRHEADGAQRQAASVNNPMFLPPASELARGLPR